MLNLLECPVNPDLANDCRQLLRDYSRKPMDRQFDIDLCHIAAKYSDCIQGLRWKPEPSMPAEYGTFLSRSFKDRAIYLDQHPTFMTVGKVAVYLDQRDMIINLNKRNMNLLLSWIKLELSDEAREVVDKVLNTYSGRA